MSKIRNSKGTPQDMMALKRDHLALRPKRNNPMEQLNKAAQMYEKHFLNEMVKAMRTSVSKGGLVKESMGDRIYTQELDQEYVKSWVTKGGVGLAKLIKDQMMQQFGIRPPAPAPADGAGGMFKIQQKPSSSPNKINMKIESTSPQSAVSLPWAGKVSSWHSNQNPNSTEGHLLVNHGDFDSLWSLPKKPNVSEGQDLAAGTLLLNTVPSEALHLEIRNKVFG